MNTTSTQALPGTPIQLDTDLPPNDFPSAPQQYLLLHTRALEDWAYRPSPPDSGVLAAYAPGVVDLVRAISPLAVRRWLWEDPSLDPERGPLLVEATGETALIHHAQAQWAPADGVLFIGAECGMDELHRHLTSNVHIVMPDRGQALFAFIPGQLDAWLQALAPEHRESWLGQITQLLWRDNLGPSHRWLKVDRPTPGSSETQPGWLHLQLQELSAFEQRLREHFIISIANELLMIPGYDTLSQSQAQIQVRKTLTQLEERHFTADEHFRDCLLLLARHPELQTDPAAHALLNELDEPPSARVRALAALANEEEVQP